MVDPAGYPPEPWHLRGRMHASVWCVPAAELPALPPGVRPLTVAGRAFVIAAWAGYQPPGVLSYRELMVTVVVRGLPSVTIPHIWVDSPVSLAGGRALWHIPKELAEFTLADEPHFTATAHADGNLLAGAEFTRRRTVPVRLPVAFSVRQRGPRRSRVRVTARLGVARAAWRVGASGPLAFLAGRRPVISLVARDFRMRFGGA
ncbi:acetoacetate decarboxylase family protein [Amycolatopsis granulosa]|uniref:acetoacetate decarboxylase family protein n=1 Tax=Amycolatopsis granulosa TaxID=185684 RepID=UPI0014247C78|nr:acetoacetate decarboxylase family protein [Amycolatopsis granulosa]